MPREPVYLISAKRTAIGRYLGSLRDKSAVELAAAAAAAALEEAEISREDIDEVIVGNVLSATAGMGIARQIARAVEIPDETPAYSLNMICGSGMKAATDACSRIKAGEADIILAVGCESMSNAGFIYSGRLRRGIRSGALEARDEILANGLTDAFFDIPMGITAENLAARYLISREEQDDYAFAGAEKTLLAQTTGCFDSEIAPIFFDDARRAFLRDEIPRPEPDRAAYRRLPPVFKNDGTVSAANSAPYADGAAALIIAGESAVKRLNLVPLAEILAYGQGGVSPELMGLGSVPAIAQALERADLPLAAIEHLELNEAFAAQTLAVLKELEEQHETDFDTLNDLTNPYGGALALGHPLGCSGARVLTTLAHALPRENRRLGLAALCIGGGMGIAAILRRI